MDRRDFLRFSLSAVGGSSLFAPRLWGFEPLSVANPLGVYPNRGWEEVYRDQYRVDESFTWVCAPNDTHMCRLRAFVRNGVILRSEQNYDHDKCGDLYGNRATKAWNPRGCPKGYTMQRRVYGPYRLKGPVLRKGWKDWADAGFPSLSDKPDLRRQYKFDTRGTDTFVRVSWDEAYRYLAGGLEAIARTYSGDAGKARLAKDGYDPLMIDQVQGAGTRTIKVGSNLPIHGVVGKFGIYRLANLLGLLDYHVRKLDDPAKARGARDWNEYTWRGDQAPGMPFVHGLQTADMDMNDLRFCKLVIQVGKNLIENKMPESHWLNEVMERGGKLVDIAPEYNCPATKSNYWIGVRPGLSDTAVFLGITKILMDEGWYDAAFVRRFTDFPLLVRTDTLKRLRPEEVIKDYKPKDLTRGPSYSIQGLTDQQRARVGDFTVWDTKAGRVVAVSRDEVGARMPVEAALTGSYTVALLDGTKVEVMPIFEMYKRHLADYDPKTVEEISGAAPELVRRLAEDIWQTTRTGHPVSIHIGEGINHYFHATLHNRATHLPLMLTGNIGKHGAGVYTWAGNYKGALLQASSWSGPGVGVYTHEDPFHPVLDEKARITHEHLRHLSDAEDPSYWACGEKVLALSTPQGRKLFTGKTHMPTPTKAFWYNNANFLNQAKWIYNIIVNVLPKVDLIVDQQIEWTGSAEYSDVVLPVNSWVEFQDYEAGASCSNPFLQVWKGGIKPVYDSRDDGEVFAGVARALAAQLKDQRFADYFKFITEKKAQVYLQRVFDSSSTTRAKDRSYQVDDLLAGKYGGEPGAALLLFRTYPRVPFWEQVHDSIPFYTDSGRLSSYCDLPEAIEYGENLVVHREAVEATPYLPNVIVSTSPFIRPANYNIPLDTLDADLRQVRNVKLPWAEAKKTVNPLWQRGFHFFCCTPKSRHSTHSSWSTVDWHWIWSDNFGDPYRADKRAPGVADRQIQMNPQAAKDLGINEGDYVYVDANPEDRPYVGWNAAADKDSFRHKAFRCLVRVKFNPGLPYNFTIMKHTGWIATERSVRAHETRPDGRALAAGTGYQASYRYGSHQSITRGWMPPMHQTDTLFHKRTGAMAFVFGADVDNHAINTVPKETLIRITKAEDGGIGGKGRWEPGVQGYGPDQPTPQNQKYLTGGYVLVQRNG
jgi:nitrate reductase alpha subunit